MNETIKQGFGLGVSLRNKGFKIKAKNELIKALDDYATYENKLHCILKLAELVDKSIPFLLIDEENIKDMQMFLAGLINGLNKSIDDVVTAKEASRIVDKDVSNINRAISSGRLVEGVDCRKSGTTWLIEKSSLLREFGETKTEQ